jgi:hypothetical protein
MGTREHQFFAGIFNEVKRHRRGRPVMIFLKSLAALRFCEKYQVGLFNNFSECLKINASNCDNLLIMKFAKFTYCTLSDKRARWACTRQMEIASADARESRAVRF